MNRLQLGESNKRGRIVLRFIHLCCACGLFVARLLLLRLWLRLFDSKYPPEEWPRRLGRTAARFCEKQGAAFIKIAQILSTRPDLLSPVMLEELQRLQDEVAPLGFGLMRPVLEADLGRPVEEVFESFDKEPIAAASIAQVYPAVLKSGEAAAVKVKKPFVARRMALDLVIVDRLARLVSRLRRFRHLQLEEQFRRIAEGIYAQLDFALERRNNRRLAEGFKDLDWVRLPRLYEECSGPNVITMEFIEGVKLPEWLAGDPPDRERDALRLYKIYLRMAYEIFALHADLHPGNLLIDGRDRFVILDTGLVVEVPREYVRRFVRLSFAFASLDGGMLAAAYFDDRPPPPEYEKVRGELTGALDQWRGRPMAEIDFGRIGLELMALFRKHRIAVDPEMSMLFVSDMVFEGMAMMADPGVDIFKLIVEEISRLSRKGSWLKPEDLVFRPPAAAKRSD